MLAGMQNSAATMGNSIEVLKKKLKIEQPYDPAILLLGRGDPKELKSGSQRDISTLMFIAALFTITEIWTHPKWIKIFGIHIQ